METLVVQMQTEGSFYNRHFFFYFFKLGYIIASFIGQTCADSSSKDNCANN
jgi:hypothetical protein